MPTDIKPNQVYKTAAGNTLTIVRVTTHTIFFTTSKGLHDSRAANRAVWNIANKIWELQKN